jgi:hypothetical protein
MRDSGTDGSPEPVRRIASPCVGVCKIDESTGYCEGCWRTLREIAGWLSYSDAERARVITILAARRGACGRRL